MFKTMKTRALTIALAAVICVGVAPRTFAQSETNKTEAGSVQTTAPKAPKAAPVIPKSTAYTLLAGGETRGNRDGAAAKSLISEPMGLSVDEKGVIYFCDSGNGTIRTIDKGTVSTYAGLVTPKNIYGVSVGGFVDGDAKTKAVFSRPTDIKVGGGAAFVVDAGNHAIRVIMNGKVTTLAGNGKPGYKDGTGTAASFNNPTSIAIGDNGTIYVSDTQNHVIRAIDRTGKTTTVAGTGGQAGYQDGNALSAKLFQPKGLAFYQGTLYIADSGNQRIRALKNGVLSTVAGSGTEKFPSTNYYVGGMADGAANKAKFSNPSALTIDAKGNLYIADTNNSAIRKLSGGQVTTVLNGDTIEAPEGIVLLGGKLVVADSFKNKVVSVTAK